MTMQLLFPACEEFTCQLLFSVCSLQKEQVRQTSWMTQNGWNVFSTFGPGISTYCPEADRQCWLSSFKTTGAGSQNKVAPGNECAVLFSLDLKYAWRELESAEVDNQWENLYNFCKTGNCYAIAVVLLPCTSLKSATNAHTNDITHNDISICASNQWKQLRELFYFSL